jgi:hypothetical protein
MNQSRAGVRRAVRNPDGSRRAARDCGGGRATAAADYAGGRPRWLGDGALSRRALVADIGERLNAAAGRETVSDGRRERQASSRWPRRPAFLRFISSRRLDWAASSSWEDSRYQSFSRHLSSFCQNSCSQFDWSNVGSRILAAI